MKVTIQITGPVACGKTHLMGYFRDAVARMEMETGQKIELEATESSEPRGSGEERVNTELARNEPGFVERLNELTKGKKAP